MVDLARHHDPAEDDPGRAHPEGRLLSIHAGARAFALTAEAYDRARPTYPPEALDWVVESLGLRVGDLVVDVAAGTGKLTSLLVARGLRVVAVEPVPEMREVLAARVPAAEVREGTAESLPVGDAEAKALTVAQAFHWFAPDRALPEFARVLDPDGAFAIFANIRDNRDALQRELEELMAPHRGTYPNPNWPETLPDSPLFEPELRTFAHEQLLDRATLVERVSSVSWIAALPADERAGVIDAARSLAARQREPIRLPYVTEVFLCRRRKSAQSTR